jgi:hypothetical protein
VALRTVRRSDCITTIAATLTGNRPKKAATGEGRGVVEHQQNPPDPVKLKQKKNHTKAAMHTAHTPPAQITPAALMVAARRQTPSIPWPAQSCKRAAVGERNQPQCFEQKIPGNKQYSILVYM